MINRTPNGSFERRHSEKDKLSYFMAEECFESSSLATFDKLEAFPRFVTKRSLSRFVVKYEIYKQILNVNGVIIECGVFNGAGLFTWAQLANIFEPTNYNRKIIGFDTFEGFPNVNEQDNSEIHKPQIGDLRGDSLKELNKAIEKYNSERHLSHIENVELIKGDFLTTSTDYLQKNKHLLVSLLYLDFDLYEPTKRALDIFLPRMGKGSIICFDELNCENYPGETLALLEKLDISNYQINRLPIDPWISYIIL
ncbi:TylF/MycF/NovP-related O-methyltransferase [Lysinibacillus louembei]|uniref:TylF/MycF/NovP-related O-methyltransferase n=1 Tax=Lysinibacillus louembei TaxID=1470088 RepID=A0ABZ0S020_9BACI|nr:TylF/MycF/NovP-related O-methyltransferase [Lysinibacillus louembei]WPK12393.1 TylF/MycF/NovP-related O-methyltransferase [Lysinibacillus louembei]